MRSLAIVFVFLASATGMTEARDPAPATKDTAPAPAAPPATVQSMADAANQKNRRANSSVSYALFPATPVGAPKNVRRALCPKAIEVTGISKRALGCTIPDIFGENNLSDEYLEKLRNWAERIAAENANDPYGFHPEIHLNLEALNDAGLNEAEYDMKKPPSEKIERDWNVNRFPKDLVPEGKPLPDHMRPWNGDTGAQNPEKEIEEEEQSVEDMFNIPSLVKVTKEIAPEEMPWNVPAKTAPKDVMTKTTTANPWLEGREAKADPELSPASPEFRGIVSVGKEQVYG